MLSEDTSISGKSTGIDAAIFENLLLLKMKRIKPSEPELRGLFERYYNALESMGKIIDELRV